MNYLAFFLTVLGAVLILAGVRRWTAWGVLGFAIGFLLGGDVRFVNALGAAAKRDLREDFYPVAHRLTRHEQSLQHIAELERDLGLT